MRLLCFEWLPVQSDVGALEYEQYWFIYNVKREIIFCQSTEIL